MIDQQLLQKAKPVQKLEDGSNLRNKNSVMYFQVSLKPLLLVPWSEWKDAGLLQCFLSAANYYLQKTTCK